MDIEPISSFNTIGSLKFATSEVILKRVDDDQTEEGITLYLSPDAPPEKILNEARQQISKDRWWLWEAYEAKELPKEQIELTDGNHEITIYNYGVDLEQRHLDEIQEVLGIFAGIRDGIAFQHLRYLVIDDDQPINPKNGELQNGSGPVHTDRIALYPAAFRDMPSKVTPKTSHLKGTLTHEITHGLTDEFVLESNDTKDKYFINQWIKIGKWKIGELRTLPGGSVSARYTEEPERCVSEYAKFDQDEDMCESMVANVFDPEILDEEKRAALQQNFPLNQEQVSKWQSRRVPKSEIRLPKTPDEIKVRFKDLGIKVLELHLGDEKS
jgi:hypothetical protein